MFDEDYRLTARKEGRLSELLERSRPPAFYEDDQFDQDEQ